jgi:alpha-tubulin suppressor-like RCC1 family protein
VGLKVRNLFVAIVVLSLAGFGVTEVRAADPTSPGSVSSLTTTTKSPTAISLTWGLPSDTGQLPIDDYLIQYKKDDGVWTTEPDGTSTVTSYRVYSLTRGSTYSFRVAAVNALGQGPFTEVGPLKIASVPLAPVDVRVSGSTNSAIYSSVARTVSWTPFDDGGSAITDYVIQYTSDGSTWVTVDDGVSNQTSVTVSGLTRGVRYTFRVAAVNSEGQSNFSRVRVVGAGRLHSCEVRQLSAYCFGSNFYSQVGQSPPGGNYAAATLVPNLGSVVDLALGDSHTCALLSDKTVQCFGRNNVGQLGRALGMSATTYTAGTKVVDSAGQTLSNVSQITSGADFVCALTVSSTVYCWGDRTWGQVAGDAISATGVSSARLASGLRDIRSLSAGIGGWHACALTWSGSVFCWGRNDWRELGDGTTTSSATPVAVAGLGNVVQVSAGAAHSCARLDTGLVRCWGGNTEGQLGLGNRTVQTGHVEVAGISGATDVIAGGDRTCVMTGSGLSCWGRNDYFQIGNGQSATVLNPYSIPGAASGHLVVSQTHAMFISSRGLILGWGLGGSFQLGTGASLSYSTPVSTLSPSDANVASTTVIVTVPDSPTAVVESEHGETSSTVTWSAPVDDGGGSISDYQIQYSINGTSWTTFSDGVNATIGTTVTGLTRGTAYFFRVAATNSAGTGAYSSPSVASTPGVVPRPVNRLRAKRWVSGYRPAEIKLEWSAPDNGGRVITDYEIDFRQEGDDAWTRHSDGMSTQSSTTIEGLSRGSRYEVRVRAINAEGVGPWSYLGGEGLALGGSFACQNRSNATVSCWGANSSGQIGDGSTTARNSPTLAVGLGTSVSGIDAGSSHACFLHDFVDGLGGKVSCFGNNSSGQLGPLGTVGSSSSSPLSAISTRSVIQISAGGNSSCALKVDSTVLCWGKNDVGQLGDGTTTDSPSPVTVSGISTAVAVSVGASHACALLASGGVRCWGANASGQLGNSSTSGSLVPVAVPGLGSVSAISVGGSHSCAIVSGQVFCWGANAAGQLGNGGVTASSTPVAVTTISSASTLALGSSHSCALLSDTSVRCWGSNVAGQLGDGSNLNRSTPVSTGLTGVVDLSLGDLFGCAVDLASDVKCWGAGGSGQLGNGANDASNIPVAVSGLGVSNTRVPLTSPSAVRGAIEDNHSTSSVSLSWNAPLDDGGSPVIGYRITGGSSVIEVSSDVLSATVSSLTRGASYTFTVIPLNSINSADVGLTPTATVGPVIPATKPSAVAGLSKTAATATSISIAWSLPIDDGGRLISDYLIEYRREGVVDWLVFPDGVSASTSATITGLTRGQPYEVRVSAINAEGTGPSMQISTSVIPASVPSAPVLTSVPTVLSGSSVSVSWDAPTDNGGDVVIDYVIQYRENSGSWQTFADAVSTNRTATLTGLTRSAIVEVRVAAVNSAGTSAFGPAFEPSMQSMVLGWSHCLVDSQGDVWCWGNNSNGQLGHNVDGDHLQLVRIPGLPAVQKVTVGSNFTCALAVGGSVYCWGSNSVGQLGDGTTSSSKLPVQVVGVSNAVDIDSGFDFACAVMASGSVFCWGSNAYRQAAPNNSASQISTPTQVSNLTSAVSLATSKYSTCVRLSGGSVSCWGRNEWNQSGSIATTTTFLTSPTSVRLSSSTVLSSVADVKSDFGADAFCATTSGGALYCWGANNAGQLGRGSSTQSQYATIVSGSWTAVAVGSGHTCAINTASEVRCWGFNSAGQVTGGSSRANVSSPTLLATGATAVWTGLYASCLRTSAGAVRCWGYNGDYALSQTEPNLGGGPYEVTFARVAVIPREDPSAPTSLVVSNINTSQATLSWSAPSDNGGAAIWDYRIEVSVNGGGWTGVADGRSASTSFVQTGLTRSATYRWRVAAVSEAGLVSLTETMGSVVYAATLPSSPVTVAMASRTATSVSLTWSAPVDDGGRPISDYIIEYRTGNSSWVALDDAVSTLTSATVGGLTKGQIYDFRVAAVNSVGTGSVSQIQVIPSTEPGAPGMLSEAAYTKTSVAITWVAPSDDGGISITDYVVEYKPLNGSWTTFADGVGTGLSVMVTGLTPGVGYSFRVSAVNPNGVGSAAISGSESVPRGLPGPVESLAEVSHSATSVSLTWNAPSDSGGAVVADYLVEYRPYGGEWSLFNDGASVSTSVTVTGLTRGLAYRFRVSAKNSEGSGPSVVLGSTLAPLSIAWGRNFGCGVEASLESWGMVYCTGTAPFGSAWPAQQWVQIARANSVIQMDVGVDHACAVISGGQVRCWGANDFGQLGNGTSTGSSSAVDVAGLTDVVQVAVGQAFSCARKSDGSVWCWGAGDSGRNGVGQNISTPQRLTSLSSSTDIVAGDWYACSLDTYVRCWGHPNDGRLGNPGNLNITTTPQIVRIGTSSTAYLTTVVDIDTHATAATTCAVRSNGSVWCWGQSNAGQAGVWAATTYARQISNVSSAREVSLGQGHACARSSTGEVWCWGWNSAGMIGDGTRTDRNSATRVISSGARGIAAGYLNSSAEVNGMLYLWGDNDGGQQARPVSADIGDDLLIPTIGTFDTPYTNCRDCPIPATVPNTVDSLVETGYGPSSISLSWSAPADDGGRSISDYSIEFRASGGNWSTFSDGVSTSTSVTVTGLTNGTKYLFRVAAVNAEGAGNPVETVLESEPRAVPAAPLALSEVSHTTDSVLLSWSPPSDNGGRAISDYVVELRAQGQTWVTYNDDVSSTTTATVSGLMRGTSYDFRVRAVNTEGSGVESATVTVVPATVPSAPVISTISAPVGGSSLRVEYAVADNGGRSLSSIQYRLNSGSWLVGSSGSSCCSGSLLITGLTNGTEYSVSLRVLNYDGPSDNSLAISGVPATSPSAPVISNISRPTEGGSLAVTFTLGSPNGREITAVQYSLDGVTWLSRSDGGVTSSPLVITGLVNGQSYQVRLRALNAQGQSGASGVVVQSPATVPSVPTAIRVEPANSKLSIVFGSPMTNGGLAITNYEYSIDNGETWLTRSPAAVTSPITVTGLTNGVIYAVKLRAVNPQGSGAESAEATAVPVAVPNAPIVDSISRPVAGEKLSITFLPPDSDGGSPVLSYQYSINGGLTWFDRNDSQTTASPMIVEGLTNGVTYKVSLRAKNALGTGLSSTSIDAVPAGRPLAPSALAGSTPIQGGRVDVEFEPANGNGAPIMNYEVSLDNGSTWSPRADGETVASPLRIQGLTNGATYIVRIRGVNEQGSGMQSALLALTPATTPSAPSIKGYSYGESRFTVDVEEATDNGGAQVSAFDISVDAGASWTETGSSSTSITVIGVAAGATYPVVVRSSNRQGPSVASRISYVTVGEKPAGSTTGAADVTSSSARLEGLVNAHYVRTRVDFQLSTRSDFSSNVISFGAGFVSGGEDTYVSVDVSDLSESTTYFYRVVAENSLGKHTTETLTFKTRRPIGVSLQNGDVYTRSSAVRLQMSWPRGAVAALVSNDGGFTDTTRFALADEVGWVLQSSGPERLPKTVYVKFVLADGSRSSTYTDDIILDETSPTLGAVTLERVTEVGVVVLEVRNHRLKVNASDSNSGIGLFELRKSPGSEPIAVPASFPAASTHEFVVSAEVNAIEIRAVDKAGNTSDWKAIDMVSASTATAANTSLVGESKGSVIVRKVGSKVSITSLMSAVKIKKTPGSKTTIKALSKSCSVEGTGLRLQAAGMCKVRLTVTSAKGKTTRKTVTIRSR